MSLIKNSSQRTLTASASSEPMQHYFSTLNFSKKDSAALKKHINMSAAENKSQQQSTMNSKSDSNISLAKIAQPTQNLAQMIDTKQSNQNQSVTANSAQYPSKQTRDGSSPVNTKKSSLTSRAGSQIVESLKSKQNPTSQIQPKTARLVTTKTQLQSQSLSGNQLQTNKPNTNNNNNNNNNNMVAPATQQPNRLGSSYLNVLCDKENIDLNVLQNALTQLQDSKSFLSLTAQQSTNIQLRKQPTPLNQSDGIIQLSKIRQNSNESATLRNPLQKSRKTTLLANSSETANGDTNEIVFLSTEAGSLPQSSIDRSQTNALRMTTEEDELNHISSTSNPCANHPDKKGKYVIIDQRINSQAEKIIVCSRCAISLAGNGYTIEEIGKTMKTTEDQMKEEMSLLLMTINEKKSVYEQAMSHLRSRKDQLYSRMINTTAFIEDSFLTLERTLIDRKNAVLADLRCERQQSDDLFACLHDEGRNTLTELNTIASDILLHHESILQSIEIESFSSIMNNYKSKIKNIDVFFSNLRGATLPTSTIHIDTRSTSIQQLFSVSTEISALLSENLPLTTANAKFTKVIESYDSNNPNKQYPTAAAAAAYSQETCLKVAQPTVYSSINTAAAAAIPVQRNAAESSADSRMKFQIAEKFFSSIGVPCTQTESIVVKSTSHLLNTSQASGNMNSLTQNNNNTLTKFNAIRPTTFTQVPPVYENSNNIVDYLHHKGIDDQIDNIMYQSPEIRQKGGFGNKQQVNMIPINDTPATTVPLQMLFTKSPVQQQLTENMNQTNWRNRIEGINTIVSSIAAAPAENQLGPASSPSNFNFLFKEKCEEQNQSNSLQFESNSLRQNGSRYGASRMLFPQLSSGGVAGGNAAEDLLASTGSCAGNNNNNNNNNGTASKSDKYKTILEKIHANQTRNSNFYSDLIPSSFTLTENDAAMQAANLASAERKPHLSEMNSHCELINSSRNCCVQEQKISKSEGNLKNGFDFTVNDSLVEDEMCLDQQYNSTSKFASAELQNSDQMHNNISFF